MEFGTLGNPWTVPRSICCAEEHTRIETLTPSGRCARFEVLTETPLSGVAGMSARMILGEGLWNALAAIEPAPGPSPIRPSARAGMLARMSLVRGQELYLTAIDPQRQMSPL